MKAVLLPGNKEVQLVDRPEPQPGPGEVLVRTRASAICRSDMSLYYGRSTLPGGKRDAIIPGHEPAGDVVAVGEGVTRVRPGDRVTIYLALGCGACEWCHRGDRMLCSSFKCLGFDVDGGDAEYFLAPEANCLPLPDELSYSAGTVLTDMVGTQYTAHRRLATSGADTVAVFGIGPMGAASILVGKARGARVVAVDVLPSRLEQALSLGADLVVDASGGDVDERLRAATDGKGIDAAIDCSGSESAHNAALDALRPYGRLAMVGETRSSTINPSDQMIRKLLTVIGAWYFPLWEYDDVVRLVMQHGMPIEGLISHRFSLDDAAEAFRMFDERETEKAIFVWD